MTSDDGKQRSLLREFDCLNSRQCTPATSLSELRIVSSWMNTTEGSEDAKETPSDSLVSLRSTTRNRSAIPLGGAHK